MKTVCALALLGAVLFTAGCGQSKLADCQQQNQSLQQELQAAKDAAGAKDKTIADMKAENVQMQTKAMEGITTMMQKEAARDKQVTEKLTAAEKEAAQLRTELEQVKAERDQLRSAPAPAAPATSAP